ncbi:MAG: class I SAM-dependent methyltransferase [Alicyclobacillaceae bacterium]|nr:class I SAM-dependent methyltransferase [Alicyclobacillaceae bacterium]
MSHCEELSYSASKTPLSSLSSRLLWLANHVPMNSRVVDVGADHALLSLYLVESGISPFVVASEVAEGPLTVAKKNVESRRLQHLVDVRHGDGLCTVAPGEVSVAVLAGMGGSTMLEIFQRSPRVVENLPCLLLQPMSDSGPLRHWLRTVGFVLVDEAVLHEKQRIYELIAATRVSHAANSRADCLLPREDSLSDPLYAPFTASPAWIWFAERFGPLNLRRGDAITRLWVEQEIESWRRILRSLRSAKEPFKNGREAEFRQKIEVASDWLEQRDRCSDGSVRPDSPAN